MKIKDCFVIMPFSASKSHLEDKWTEIFEKFFKPAWNAFDIDCHRTQVTRGSITKDIIEKLYSASIVFADLTDSNPNVLYELGVRHTFKKPSIMVKGKGSEIPFDVNDYKVFEYEYTPKGLEDLRGHIGAAIQDITQYPNKRDNPVWDFLNIGDFGVDQYKKTENIPKLEALNEEFASNLERCFDLLEAIKGVEISVEVPREENRKVESSIMAFYPNIRSDALTHLRVTRYVSFLDEDWETLNKIDEFYRWCQVCSNNLGVYEMEECDKKTISEILETIKVGMDTISRRIQEIFELR